MTYAAGETKAPERDGRRKNVMNKAASKESLIQAKIGKQENKEKRKCRREKVRAIEKKSSNV